jgi:antitoxin component YwqK of YwqJK toxin-antitoxin module
VEHIIQELKNLAEMAYATTSDRSPEHEVWFRVYGTNLKQFLHGETFLESKLQNGELREYYTNGKMIRKYKEPNGIMVTIPFKQHFQNRETSLEEMLDFVAQQIEMIAEQIKEEKHDK